MFIAESGPSPFVVVWHLFLAFAGVVLCFHIVCAVLTVILRRYVRHLEKTRLSKVHREKAI